MIYGNEIILRYVKGKDVLDIGSCGNQGGKIKPKTLFSQMKKRAKSLTGVDIEGDNKEVIKGDAETISLKKKFDVIIAGDVIEHLNNPGLFVQNMEKHLKDNGTFIVLTPNVKSIGYLPGKGNAYHKMWFCRRTLSLLLRDNGWKIKKVYIGLRRPVNPVHDFLRYLFANTLIVVAKT